MNDACERGEVRGKMSASCDGAALQAAFLQNLKFHAQLNQRVFVTCQCEASRGF